MRTEIRNAKSVSLANASIVAMTLLAAASAYGQSHTSGSAYKGVHWNLAALIDSGSSLLSVLGDPERLSGEFGPSVVFDGVDDALFLDADPLKGLDRFTVEVAFRPASGGAAAQRFLHMGEMSRDRIMIETRLNDRGEWYLDTHVRSGDSATSLIDSTMTHPLDEWYHVALVVENGRMEAYVNRIFELGAKIPFAPLKGGKTSIGVRQNKVYWFKGAIAWVRVTPECLEAKKFKFP